MKGSSWQLNWLLINLTCTLPTANNCEQAALLSASLPLAAQINNVHAAHA